eukprot:1808345-Pyramimonas_sp.AAC.1
MPRCKGNTTIMILLRIEMRGDLEYCNFGGRPDLQQLTNFPPDRCQRAFRVKIRLIPPAPDNSFIVGNKANIPLRVPDRDLQSTKFPQ